MLNIPRPEYTDKILRFIDKGLILVLTGQRRVGKSYILRQLAGLIRQSNPSANLISINKEKVEFDDLRDYRDLHAYVSQRLHPDKANYLLIDEVQDIEGFEHALRSFNSDEECQIIVTGSNAKMLSSELSTYLSGRYMETHIYSLSYQEFLRFHNLDDSPAALQKYLKFGGMPYLAHIGIENEEMARDYLANIYNTIVLKDVVQREGLRNVAMFENVMRFVSDNVGQLVSASSMSAYLKSKKVELTPLTALNYLRNASNAYIVNRVNRYDIHGKRLLESNDKYYFEDLGLRNILIDRRETSDIEKIIENAVYLHLVTSGWKVSVGTLPNGEVDFVAERYGSRIYVQAKYMLSSETTIAREFGNLAAIRDHFPKYVVSLDPVAGKECYEGITHLPLRTFLTSTLPV